MRRFFAERWFLLVLMTLLMSGLAWSRQLLWLSQASPKLLVIAVVMLATSLATNFKTALAARASWAAVGAALVVNAGLAPPLGWLIGRPLPELIAQGLVVAMSVPCTIAAAIVWTRRGGGNDAAAALTEGLNAGIEAARAGNQTRDVANALNAALAKAGIERSARCGYPIGLSYPPDWGERTMSFRPEDETVLKPGMTFHFMPGLWMDGWGCALTESILITQDGPAECLCDRPRELFVKP